MIRTKKMKLVALVVFSIVSAPVQGKADATVESYIAALNSINTIMESDKNGGLSAKDVGDIAMSFIGLSGEIIGEIRKDSLLAESFGVAGTLYGLGRDIYDLAEGLKELKEARKNNDADKIVEAQLKIGNTALSGLRNVIDVGQKGNLLVAGTKTTVIVAEIAVDKYGDFVRENAAENVRTMMSLKNSAIDDLRGKINEIIEINKFADKQVSIDYISAEIRRIARNYINEMEAYPLNQYRPTGEGPEWGFDSLFTGNIEQKTYNEVYSYLIDVLNGNNAIFNVAEVVRRIEMARAKETVSKINELATQAAEKTERYVPSGEGEKPSPTPQPCGVASCTGDPPKKDTENPPNKETSKDPVTPTVYNFRGFFTGKLSGAESFVGRRMELLGGSFFQTLAAGTNGSLAPVPGVSWQWYSYFDGKKGTNPDYSNNIPITITSASKQEGTVTGAPAVSGQTYNHLYFGEYAGGVTVTGDNYSLPIERGHWIIGSQTDPANVPRSGSANTTFQGGLDGIATNGEKINGRVNLYMDFASQNLSGWMHFRREDTTRWGLASFSSVSVSNGRFSGNGTFQSYLNPSNTSGQANIYGSFYGQQAQEIGGGWSIWNTGDNLMGAMGIYRGKEGFANEAAPAAPATPNPPPASVSYLYDGHMGAKILNETSLITRKLETLPNGTGTIPLGSEITPGQQVTLRGDGFSNTFKVDVNATTQGAYAYTHWGEWSNPNGVTIDGTGRQIEKAYWVAGQRTLVNQMPQTGTATYNGEARGYTFGGQTVNGTIALNADFANRTVAADLRLKDPTNNPWVNMSISGMPITGDNYFGSGVLTSPSTGTTITNSNGWIGGSFYGQPSAASGNKPPETAGWFAVSGAPGVGGADGVFRAKR